MIMNGQYLLFGALVLGVTSGDNADTTPLPDETEADKVVKTLISPGGEIYELLMEVLNATYGYLLFQKDIWEDFGSDEELFERNLDAIWWTIHNTSKSVKSILPMLHGVSNAAAYEPQMRWNLEYEAYKIASDLKDVYEIFLDYDIPLSFKQKDKKLFKSLLALRIGIRDDFRGLQTDSYKYKALYAEMKSLQKKGIDWSIIILEARRFYTKGMPKRSLRLAGFQAVLGAREAKKFNYRLIHSRLPNLITNMITNVKKVIGPMLQLWKKYNIEVDTDIDFSRYYIKRPKDGVTRSPYNIDKLQEEAKDVHLPLDWLFWEMEFYRGYRIRGAPPPIID